MLKKTTMILGLAAILVLPLTIPVLAHGEEAHAEEGTWTGEVLDLPCYVAHASMGEDHKSCAKNCVKGGQPMGLLTEDGQVVVLAADHGNGAPFEALKDLAGEMAEVTGELAERGGMKVLTVKESKAAS